MRGKREREREGGREREGKREEWEKERIKGGMEGEE